MGWRRNWSERPPRPKARKLSDDEREKMLLCIKKSIKNSPVLSALNYRVKSLRGRFYYEQVLSDSVIDVVGRITPLVTPNDNFLLEVEFGKNKWKEIAKGKIRTITNAVSGDKKGTFHGLGILDKSIRIANKNRIQKIAIVKTDENSFYYSEANKQCGCQEVLYHYFGVPICVIAEPRGWYIYHRHPYIIEIDEKRHCVLTRFTSVSSYGDSFGGTCLYIKREGEWGAFSIKPNQSESIESAILWLEKRKWKGW